LIEEHGVLTEKDGSAGMEYLREELCRRIEKATHMDGPLIRRTIAMFLEKGYIRLGQFNGIHRWLWTHNQRLTSPSNP